MLIKEKTMEFISNMWKEAK